MATALAHLLVAYLILIAPWLSRPTGATHAWRAGLDRFDWLNDLRAAGTPAAQAASVELTRRWLGENLRYREDTWRADILAARLRNLLVNSGYLVTHANADAGFKALLMGSLYRQAAHLARALPDALYGAALRRAGGHVSALGASPDGVSVTPSVRSPVEEHANRISGFESRTNYFRQAR